MANRKNYYFRQKVEEDELDTGFAYLEQADRAKSTDTDMVGVAKNAVVQEKAGGANLTVDITAPGVVYNKLGERVAWPTTQNVNVAVDENAVTTAVTTPGNSKIIGVYAKFKRVLTDPRLDGNSVTVFFDEAEGFEFVVRQGAEGASPSPPALDSTHILLADITRAFGQTTIVNANISTTRRETMLLTSQLKPTSGDVLIGSPARGGSPFSLSSSTVGAQLASLLGHLNTLSATVTAGLATSQQSIENLGSLNFDPEFTSASLSQTFFNGKLIQFQEWVVATLSTTLAHSKDLANWSAGAGVYGGAGALQDLVTDGTTILAIDQASAVTKTTNKGDTFSSAGTLPNLSGNNYHKVGYFNGIWIAMTNNKLAYDADLSGTWTDAAAQLPGSWSGIDPWQIKASPTELLILPNTSSSSVPILKTTNGTTFTSGGLFPGITGSLTDLAYSPALSKWAVCDNVGKIWLSSDGGGTWTLMFNTTLEETIVGIAALGSNWIVLCANRVMVFNADFTVRRRAMMQMGAGTANWSYLLRYIDAPAGSVSVSRVVMSAKVAASNTIRVRGGSRL